MVVLLDDVRHRNAFGKILIRIRVIELVIRHFGGRGVGSKHLWDGRLIQRSVWIGVRREGVVWSVGRNNRIGRSGSSVVPIGLWESRHFIIIR